MKKWQNQRDADERGLKRERNRDCPRPARLRVPIDESLIEHFAGVDSTDLREVPAELLG